MVRYRSGTDHIRAWLGLGGAQGALGRAGRESFARQFSRDKGGDKSVKQAWKWRQVASCIYLPP